MNQIALLLLPLCLLPGCPGSSRPASQPVTPANVAVYFSPNGGCTEAIVASLRAAKQSVLVQAYSFTSAPIAEALVNAHRRGVKV